MSEPGGEQWPVVDVVGTEEDAELIAGFLRMEKIPCRIESVHSHEFPVSVNAFGEVRLKVPAEHVEAARRLIAERETSASDDSD